MTFTEVAFELADKRHPLCRITAPPAEHFAVYRPLDHGVVSHRHRAQLTLSAPPEACAELPRELRTIHPHAQIETLYQGAHQASFAIEMSAEATADGGLSQIVPVLHSQGLQALVDPIVAERGRLRLRLVIPRQADAQEVLRALQQVQRATGFAEFRILRIGSITPAAHVEMARRALPPEQESLLALAASMGYYETPKAVTLEDIARSVGLSISPVHKRLKAAEETIVSQHVEQVGSETIRRRARARPAALEPTSPWEIELRVRGDFGPSTFLAHVPGARATLHVLSTDGARAQSMLLVVVAPEEAQAKLLANVQDRPEVASLEIVERSYQHVVCRLTARERGVYTLSWWCDAWDQDANIRSVVFEGGESLIRALIARPQTTEQLNDRLERCARAAGWVEWDLVSLRSLVNGSAPPAWPDPLTQRQLEVLRVAHALGYYRTPRACTLENVASTLGVSANAVHKNLVLAESKLVAGYLAAGL